jgi:hypothetical protein
MSSIKRGVKKVFRGAKKVVKKIAKPALIAGAIYLTAGLATGGFASMQAGSGIGGFFKSVGTTLSNGVQAVNGALGIGQAGAMKAEAGRVLGLAHSSIPFSGAAGAASTSGGGVFSAVGGLIGKASKAFQGLSNPVQTAIIGGFSGALAGAAQRKEVRRLERRQDELGFFGVQRRGSEGVVVGDFGAAVRAGFGVDAPATAQTAPPPTQTAPPPTQGLLDAPFTREEEAEDEGVMAGGFGLERGLLAQSQFNMPNFI